jgi:hypothetical protein
MWACHRGQVRVHCDILHCEIVLPNQADLRVYNICVIRIAVMHRVAVMVLHKCLLHVSLYCSHSRNHVCSKEAIHTSQSGTLCPKRLQNKLPATTGFVKFCLARITS